MTMLNTNRHLNTASRHSQQGEGLSRDHLCDCRNLRETSLRALSRTAAALQHSLQLIQFLQRNLFCVFGPNRYLQGIHL